MGVDCIGYAIVEEGVRDDEGGREKANAFNEQ